MINADVCVIGAGAAGIAIAREFVNTEISIALIEAGGMQITDEMQSLYGAEVGGLPHGGVKDGRARVFGGTTTLWAGQALPLHETDFAYRPWVPHSGWPLSKEILDPYYRRAERVMKLPHSTYGKNSWEGPLPNLRHLESESLETRFSMFTHSPNFSSLYYKQLHTCENISILIESPLVDIVLSDSEDAVESVTLRHRTGRIISVKSSFFVLCCGGIETPRLLLASIGRKIGGYNVLGKFFNEHLHVHIPVKPYSTKKLSHFFESRRSKEGIYYPKVVADKRFQSDKEILNIGADLIYKEDKRIYLDYIKDSIYNMKGGEIGKATKNIFKAAGEPAYVAKSVYRYAVKKRKLGEGLGTPHFSVQSECVPLSESRIELLDQVDRTGLPQMRLVWKLSKHELQSIRVFCAELDALLKVHRIGTLDLSYLPDSDDPAGWEDVIHDSYHHMGATRMSESAESGVVDSDCRVHGLSNLFVASSSTFPTGGFSNPTLTILALSLRLADHLKTRLS